MNKIKFPVEICPICGKSLYRRGYLINCPTQTEIGKFNYSHYQIELPSYGGNVVQRVLQLPFLLETYSDTWRSKLFKAVDNKWELLYELDAIVIQKRDDFLNKLSKLVVFS